MDSLPDVIIVTLVHKQANIGTVEINPLVTYPITEPDDGEGFELEIRVNSQKWMAEPLKTNAEAWFRLKQILYGKYRNPLLSRSSIVENDSKDTAFYHTETKTTGYPMYAISMTLMGKGSWKLLSFHFIIELFPLSYIDD